VQTACGIHSFLEENQKEGVLVLADIFGGSGCNMSLIAARDMENVEIISGVNFAMLLSAVQNAGKLSLKDLAAKVEADAKRSIVNAKSIFCSCEVKEPKKPSARRARRPKRCEAREKSEREK